MYTSVNSGFLLFVPDLGPTQLPVVPEVVPPVATVPPAPPTVARVEEVRFVEAPPIDTPPATTVERLLLALPPALLPPTALLLEAPPIVEEAPERPPLLRVDDLPPVELERSALPPVPMRVVPVPPSVVSPSESLPTAPPLPWSVEAVVAPDEPLRVVPPVDGVVATLVFERDCALDPPCEPSAGRLLTVSPPAADCTESVSLDEQANTNQPRRRAAWARTMFLGLGSTRYGMRSSHGQVSSRRVRANALAIRFCRSSMDTSGVNDAELVRPVVWCVWGGAGVTSVPGFFCLAQLQLEFP